MIIVFQPFRTIGGHSSEAYGLMITGEGLSYREIFRLRVLCPECDADLAAGLLATHWQVQHGVSHGYLVDTPLPSTCTHGISYILHSGCMRHNMTSGRMPGTGHDPERPPDPLRALPHVRHISGPGGGEPPPTVLPKMKYVCFLEVIERDSSGHGDVCQGVRAETQAAEEGGGTGKNGGGLSGLRETLG